MKNANSKLEKTFWNALIAVLVLSESYYLLKVVAELLPVAGLVGVVADSRLLLAVEFLGRIAWAVFLWHLMAKAVNVASGSDRKTIFFTWLTAVCLGLLTVFSLLCIVFGLKLSVAAAAWIRALEIYLLMIWGLAVLFMLVLPLFRETVRNRRVYTLAVVGAITYFVLKGFAWLQLVSVPIRLPVNRFRPLWLVLPLLVFLGRLALIHLISGKCRENGSASS